jgi:hypothetical protein
MLMFLLRSLCHVYLHDGPAAKSSPTARTKVEGKLIIWLPLNCSFTFVSGRIRVQELFYRTHYTIGRVLVHCLTRDISFTRSMLLHDS